MVLIYTSDYFESGNVTIVDFANDFLTLNRLHGMVVSRLDVEFYWSYGVRNAFKHGNSRQEELLRQVSDLDGWVEYLQGMETDSVRQVKSSSFEEYLGSLDGTMNGSALKKEVRIPEAGENRDLISRWVTDASQNVRRAPGNMNFEAGYSVEEPEETHLSQNARIPQAEYLLIPG